MKTVLAELLALAVILSACGGSGANSPPLHLPDGVISESAYRDSVRSWLYAVKVCSGIQGLSGQEAFKALADAELLFDLDVLGPDVALLSNQQLADYEVWLKGKKKAGHETAVAQVASAGSDTERAGRIIQEECARIQ